MPPDSAWMAVEPLGDEDFFSWPGWFTASEFSLPTLPSVPRSQLAPIYLPVAPIAEVYVDQFEEKPPPSFAAATPSCHAASMGKKRLRPRDLTIALRSWMERHHTPYATLEEKKKIAEALSIPVAKVTNFCNNYRKRFFKVGTKLTSYRELASASR